jgi:hypothetical protein
MAPNHPEYLRVYYRSNAWRLRKSRYYKRFERRCASCNRRGRNIQLHHLDYRGAGWDLRNQSAWGMEPDQSLIPLCGPRSMGLIHGCHQNVHDADKSGRFKDLREATEYIVMQGRKRQARRTMLRNLLSS